MKFFQNTGLLSKREALPAAFYFSLFRTVCCFCLAPSIRFRKRNWGPLGTGQTFEKAVVTNVLQDNLQADGSRVGDTVRPCPAFFLAPRREKSWTLLTSSSGYLFGAACTARFESHSDAECCRRNHRCQCLHPGPGNGSFTLFAGLYLLSLLLVGGGTGRLKRASFTSPGVYLFLCNFCVPPSDLPKIFSLLDRRFYLSCSPHW